jgi:nucleoid DNA-binding protein
MAKKATRKKTTRKKATKKAAARKPAKKTAKKKATRKKAATKAAAPSIKMRAADSTRTKSQFITTISDATELSKKDVAAVFEATSAILKADLSKKGPGVVNVAGMMKILVQRKPATKARKGTNPFTGEEMMFKAKPARNVVKIRPMKAVKELV